MQPTFYEAFSVVFGIGLALLTVLVIGYALARLVEIGGTLVEYAVMYIRRRRTPRSDA